MNPFQINRDRSIEQDKIFLVDKRFHPIKNGEIYPVSDLQIVANLNSNWECRFTVYRETDGIPNPLWNKITDLALVKIENKGIFELEAPVTDEAGTYKSCSGKSICEAETSQTTMTLEINTEDDIARESNTDPTASYYKEFPTIFYRDIKDISVFDHLQNSSDAAKLQALSRDQKEEILRRSSLLHRVFSEMPEYAASINGNNIDDSLKNLKEPYIFSWSDTSVYDICQDIAEEVQCIFIFDKYNRTFQVRDLKDHCEIDHCRDIEDGICPVCKQNGTTQKIASFGQYSGVEIDTHNLAETITLSGNKDSVKNYFKIEGADDVITNRISNRMIGNGYLWKTGALQRSQMSAELIAALDAREQMMSEDYPAESEYQNIQDEYNKLWDQWNALNAQKAEYQYGMMPNPEMADETAEFVFNDLFGKDGKIQYACASNFLQSANQIADSIMNYAKLLSPTNHTIEYTDLSCTKTEWNGYDVVDTITFKVHIYLEGHYKEGDKANGYADEYPSKNAQNPNNEVTLSVSKGYDITCTKEDDTVVYTNDYYNYLKRLIDTANAKSGITEEVITFNPITRVDIDPAAKFDDNDEEPLKSNHYSKYCYDRLDSFCKAYEACSTVVSEMNGTIPSETDNTIPTETIILSGEKLNKEGNCYFVAPLKSDRSLYTFLENVTYSLTISTSSSYGFHSTKLMGLLGASENINPGSYNNTLHSWNCEKKDLHTFVITFKGDGKLYSHLCIGLGSKTDYDKNYAYHFSMSVSDVTSPSSSETANILKYIKPDGEIGNNIQKDLLWKYQQYTVILSERMRWLQEQIEAMEKSQDSLMARIRKIKEICDMEHYLTNYANEHGIHQNLWYELCSFKRQDTYKNDNFIGEGVDDATLMGYVESLIKRAEEEIESACNITYSASATISNLLVMPEFEPFWDTFTLGNYIHMVIDDQIHTMRLTSITYDYADLSHCSVEFSDVIQKTKNKTEEIADILSQASSLASSAKTTARQAENGAAAKLSVDVIKNDALNLANSKIITADDQNFVIDKYGITGKYIDPVSGEVSDEQIRIINNLLCFTDDNWMHTKTALGKITYRNPDTNQYETKYGLIADTIMGNLLLGEKLIISDQNGYVRIDGNGITLDGGAIEWKNPIAKDNAINQNAVNGLVSYMDQTDNKISAANTELTTFQANVSQAMGLGTTLITANSVISPKIGGGYLYIAEGNNSIILNPHEQCAISQNGLTQANTKMVEVISNNKTVLSVDKEGNLTVNGTIYATDGEFTGTINATDGKFTGKILLDSGFLTTNANRTSFNSKTLGMTLDNNGIGGFYSPQKYFTLTSQGELTAVGATITGKINATSGYIGNAESGWKITERAIYNGCESINSSNTGMYIGADGIQSKGTGSNTKIVDGTMHLWSQECSTSCIEIASNNPETLKTTIRSSYLDISNSYGRRSAVGYIYTGTEKPSETGFYLINSDNNVNGCFHMKNNSDLSELICDHLNIANSGSVTMNPGSSQRISFPHPFDHTPKVFCSAHVSNGLNASATITDVNSTGFNLHFNRNNSNDASALIDWFAIS